jgi:hypothetical protein
MRERGVAAWTRWRGLVSEQRISGQSVSAFCRERSLCAPQFFAWKKRLSESDAAQFVAVDVVMPEEPARPACTGGCAIEVRLNGGRALVVAPGFDASHLRALLAVLERGA